MTAWPGQTPTSGTAEAWARAHLATLRRTGAQRSASPVAVSGEEDDDPPIPGPLRIQFPDDPRWVFTAGSDPGNYAVKSAVMAADENGRPVIATCASRSSEALIWDPATGDCLATLTGHQNAVNEVAWATTTDGRQVLATASADNSARIWDPATGECLATLTGHTGGVYGVACATTSDGRLLLATVSSDNTARIWDSTTGDCLTTLTDHDSTVEGVAWATTTDGRLLLATGSWDGTARIWDPATGDCLATITHPNDVNSVAFFQEPGTRPGDTGALLLATACDDALVRVYSITFTPEPSLRRRRAGGTTSTASRPTRLPSPALMPVSGTVAAISEVEFRAHSATLTGHTDRIWSVAWGTATDGRLLLATASADETARIWDPATGDCLTTLTGHTDTVYAVAWVTTSDGRLLLATGSADNTARI